jgi:16S rRNA (cytosine1402-N4)-methyltransferase
MQATPQHVPVALDRCIALLAPAIEKSISQNNSAVIIDATLGLAGHTRALLERYPELTVIGLDRDLAAIAIAQERVKEFGSRAIIVHAVYDTLEAVLEDLQIEAVDGILFDLGVSSMQLDEADRGFAYSHDAPLDMRMDQSQGLSAFDVLMTYDRNALIRILRNYGDEKFAPRIVDRIIEARSAGTLNSTKTLAEIVKESIPAPARRTGGNPAKRTFQALRIEVNQELAVLERAIPAALRAIKLEGRVVVMSYQSLEDKIVKSEFAEVCKSGTPLGLPIDLPNSAPKYRLIFSGSESASADEIESNPRAQSMRLRAVERLAA